MAVICSACGHETSTYTLKYRMDKMVATCKVCEHPHHSDQTVAANPFADLTLEHVTGEDGKPVRVTSRRQLHEAEKRYHFRSVVAHENEANFDKPPQQNSANLFEQMSKEKRWLYPEVAESMLRDLRRTGELK